MTERTPAEQAARVAGDGLSLAYRSWGAERDGLLSVVLLHGLTGSGADWAPVAERLAAAGRRVIALDARGHGASDWSPEAAYAGDAHFADVVMALDELGVRRCLLAGYSMGGGVAMLAAGAMPERVAAVAVIDAYPAPEMTPGSLQIAEWVAAFSLSGVNGRPGFDPAIARRFAEDLAAGAARRLDLWPFWEALTQPALLVRGARSTVLPEALAAEMLARQPVARLVTIPDTGHQIPFARPAALAAHLLAFLETVP